jgi:hypothetical protein
VTPRAVDDRRTASLDGRWDFFPGDHQLADLDGRSPCSISVPGLWEAQGHLDLDGTAWYRRRFVLDGVGGGWTLRFGGVMDFADVYVNGVPLGRHEQPFTPFEVDPAGALVTGRNELAVRVVDPPVGDLDHRRMAHGKQGWANHVFPSRPSLYMTYGGIWQPVTLRRHGQVVIRDVRVNGDPDDLVVRAELENRGPALTARIGLRTLGSGEQREVALAPGERSNVEVGLGATPAERWSPRSPNLHDLSVDVWSGHELSDAHMLRYGLRTIRFDEGGGRLLINGEPYRMKSVLVQGFTADRLYAEDDTEHIRAEVAAARAMGFNTLRLHIKAFDPRYLDVCDETGMLLHCDIPVAEPIVHEEMGGDSLLVRRSVEAAREQVRRDRNHPSIVLWSAMNEICDGRREARDWPEYESFARALYATVREEDPTRPVIENDWVEPDPERVFVSPLLTAHWYGRLHRDYLDKIDAAAGRWEATGRPLFVTEFGDWGLPDMPLLAEPPFWDTRAVYAAALADTLWPASVARFVAETHRYQGLSDRMQTEVFRRHDLVGGYCLTELTDVPIELNGLLDLDRRPKPMAVREMTRANQQVLPMLDLDSLVAQAGQVIQAALHVANDGEALAGVTVESRFGDSVSAVRIEELLALDAGDLPPDQVADRFRETVSEVFLGDVPAHTAAAYAEVTIAAPEVPGSHDLVLRLCAGGEEVAENRYPIHVVMPPAGDVAVRLLGPAGAEPALRAAGAVVGDRGPAVVAEGALDGTTGARARALLDEGEVVLILAQETAAAGDYPVAVELEDLTTAWGSTLFQFTTDYGALPSLPRRNVLVAEDSTVHARSVLRRVGGAPFPDTPVLIAYKPVPNAVTGTVIGSHGVGAGRLVLCQYRLTGPAAAGDPVARAVLGDLLRWIGVPRPVQTRQTLATGDGRALIAFSWHEGRGR